MCVCVCVCVRARARACVSASLCVCCVIVKCPVLPPCAVDGRSKNRLYYYYNTASLKHRLLISMISVLVRESAACKRAVLPHTRTRRPNQINGIDNSISTELSRKATLSSEPKQHTLTKNLSGSVSGSTVALVDDRQSFCFVK